jgi:hypothetical protein
MVKKIIADPRFAEMFESKKYYNNSGFKGLMCAVTGYYNEPYFKELVEKITQDFEKEKSHSEFGLLSLLQEWACNIQHSQDDIDIIWDQALKTLEYQVDLLRWALQRVDRKSNKALFVISANGLCVASEICWLLRGGYADGAIARQRTLFELVSVTGFMVYVAREIDKDIGMRWLDSEHIVRFKTYNKRIKDLEKKRAKIGLTSEEESFYRSHLPAYEEAKKKYNEVIEKYGSEFDNKYGWARQALKEINSKRVADGFDKVDLGHKGIREVTLPFLEHLHVLGNFSVHGGGEPFRAIYPMGGDGSNRTLPLGPTFYGIEHVIPDTTRLIGMLAAFVTFGFNDEDSAVASAVIRALGSRSPDEIKECIRKRELFLRNDSIAR